MLLSQHSKCTLCLAIYLVMVCPEYIRMMVDLTRRSHCNLCMMSSVVRKVFFPSDGFSTGSFRDQVRSPVLNRVS